MDIYHVWCDLKPGVSDTTFGERVTDYMEYLKTQGLIENWRLMRRKLGLAPADFREFHLMIETNGLQQLDAAFAHVAERREPVESVHFGVNSLAANVVFALYRDFPDTFRRRGEEKF
jgi:hypothetical protein